MRSRALAAAAAAGVVTGLLAFGTPGALAHENPCHSRHSCPSDHHTYVWYDGGGHGWSCAEPGAPEYDPSRDTKTIVDGGRIYHCRAAGSAGAAPHARSTSHASLGVTVELRARTKSNGCRLGALPDRRCSPGAYYSRLTKTVICSPSFRTGPIRNVSGAEKHQVEAEYGMTPGSYGRTLEVDHIVSLELGGSNDLANLYPEKAPGYHVKDRLENRLHELVCSGAMTLHAAQVGIATNWEKLYAKVFHARPSAA